MNGDNTTMSDSQDSTVEEDVIDDGKASNEKQGVTSPPPVQQTTTDFARISFLVDEETVDESTFLDNEEATDSFDAMDNTDDNTQSEHEADFDESCNTLEVPEPKD